MSETLNVGLTDTQRELLLRGLRYVRSSVTLELREPDPRDQERRRQTVQEINALVEQLNGAPAGRARV